jgi:transglutaminase-like putative cysteine protease
VIYRVRHKTTYAYESEVTFARCVLRLTPRSSATQTVLESGITVTPEPTIAFDRLGPFGELSTTVVIETPHKALLIESHVRIDVHTPPGRLDFGAAWEDVRAQALRGSELGSEAPADYLYPSVRAPLTAPITEYARASFGAGRGIVDAATELMGRMKRDFTYDSDATDVSTAPLEAFTARRGVCQDFAHIMICGLRGLGMPARYVSGFLRTYPPPGRPRLEGADATHAWVSLWCGEDVGWIGFDPTNDVLAQDDHIVLAAGRDYSDVAPIDGIILAPGKQTLDVEVDVVPESELATPRLAFG